MIAIIGFKRASYVQRPVLQLQLSDLIEGSVIGAFFSRGMFTEKMTSAAPRNNLGTDEHVLQLALAQKQCVRLSITCTSHPFVAAARGRAIVKGGKERLLATQRYTHLADHPIALANDQLGETLAGLFSGGKSRTGDGHR